MVKRKCGTCRHFKDGGIAGSGWCHHPARRDLHHMVLVRKTALECRNNWDQDLWEPAPGLAGEPDRPDVHIPEPPHIPPPPVGASPKMSGDGAPSGDMFTDRLTSITMAAPRTPTPDGDADAGRPVPPVERSDVREARRRRVEQIERDRQQQQRDRSDEARLLLEPPREAASAGLRPADPRDTPRPPRPQPPRVQPQPAQPARDEPRPAQPPMRPVAHPAQVGNRSEREAPMAERPASRPGSGGGVPARDASVSFGASPSSFQSTRRPEAQPSTRRREQARIAPGLVRGETEDLPIAEVRLQARNQRLQPDSGLNPAAISPAAASSPHDGANDRPAPEPPIDERDPGWMVWAGQIDGERSRGTRPPERPPADASPRDRLPVAMPADPLDTSQRPSTVARCCATCRDFRPVGDGKTGWCANPHAFDSKRMVESGDLACRSSVGSWWLPNDEVWLDRADTTHHSRPTPLLDDLRRAGIEREREMPSHPD